MLASKLPLFLNCDASALALLIRRSTGFRNCQRQLLEAKCAFCVQYVIFSVENHPHGTVPLIGF